jgi:hypothetical protein
MKTIIKLIVLLGIGAAQACDSAETPSTQTEKERVLELLKGSAWKAQTVEVDNTDQSDLFENFTLTIAPTSFTSSNGSPVWPTSGTWSFTNETATRISRSDGVEVRIIGVTESELILELNWSETTLGGGRTASIEGVHTFTLTR